jgi:hemoglobin
MPRPSIYEFAGGMPAFLRLAAAHHARCLADPVLNHPFSHGTREDHVERLASYWAEVFGGPTRFSASFGGHAAMLDLHAGSGAEDDMGTRFVECFTRAIDDAELPADERFRRSLRDYMQWAVGEVMSYAPADATVPRSTALPSWSWDGLEPRP